MVLANVSGAKLALNEACEQKYALSAHVMQPMSLLWIALAVAYASFSLVQICRLEARRTFQKRPHKFPRACCARTAPVSLHAPAHPPLGGHGARGGAGLLQSVPGLPLCAPGGHAGRVLLPVVFERVLAALLPGGWRVPGHGHDLPHHLDLLAAGGMASLQAGQGGGGELVLDLASDGHRGEALRRGGDSERGARVSVPRAGGPRSDAVRVDPVL